MNRYDDIIDLPYRVRTPQKPIPGSTRAAQFAPFAALEGYSDSVAESSRHTDSRTDIADDRQAELDAALRVLSGKTDAAPAAFTYYVSDTKKSGGSYTTVYGKVKRVDTFSRNVILESGERIPTDDITDISMCK